MKQALSFIISFFLLATTAFSQTIEGDKLLDLIGKPITDPLFQQLKTQEKFYTDAWDDKLTIYITRSKDIITDIELQNGKKKYSSQERYGYYTKLLPLELSWKMNRSDLNAKLGKPTLVSIAMNFSDYIYNGKKIRVFFEEDKPVSINYALLNTNTIPETTVPPPISKPVQAPVVISPTNSWIIKLDAYKNATVNWGALKQLITSTKNLQPFIGKDSVDYIGQVYYSTPYKIEGFDRSAVKRYKKKDKWYYEAFLKLGSDSEVVRKTFFSLYDELKKTFTENTGEDFILGASAEKSISVDPMNWLAQWSLYSNYKILPVGLPTVKIALMLSGMKNVFKNNAMEYVFKIYVFDGDHSFDFFTWNTPY
ncbi:MAG: hypothetical protein V4556_12595 [Bacteroidota bacterium]